jgi:hypothetical protein
LGGACFVHVPANVLYVFISKSTGFVVLCVSVGAVFHASPPLLSFWQNYLISVGLSRLHFLHHGYASHSSPPPPSENPWTLIALYVAFTFFVSTTPSFHFVSKTFLETELGEALNDKIYLKSDRGAQLVLWPWTARDATDTQPLSEKWPRGQPVNPAYKDLHSVGFCGEISFWRIWASGPVTLSCCSIRWNFRTMKKGQQRGPKRR